MRDELIKLITVKGEKRSSRGFSEGEDIEETEVFASVLSVTGTEFYDALRSGIDAKIKFAVDPDDYILGNYLVDGKVKKPSRIRWNEIEYRIIRESKVNRHEIQITCEEVS